MARHLLYVNWDGFDSRYLGRAETPVLDRLAQTGALYPRALSGIPTITPCMQTTIVTGAWPATHGNTYRYFDRAAGIARQTSRENRAETIAEAALAAGLSTASVQQFTLRGRGTEPGRPGQIYLEPGGGMARRLAEALKLLRSGDPPRFLAFYADDLDALGHNHQLHPDYEHHRLAKAEAERLELTLERLALMDRLLGELVDALPAESALVLTSDHGMIGFSGRSHLPAVLAALRRTGLRPEVLDRDARPAAGTDLAVVTVGIQVQLSWVGEPAEGQRWALAEALAELSAAEWFGGWMGREELARRGAHDSFADLLLWPREGGHCHVQDELDFPPVASHDTPLAAHVPLLLWGSGVRPVAAPAGPARVIDAAPTMACLLGIRPPAQATGRVLTEALDGAEQHG